MAASAFKVFNKAKGGLGTASINLNSGNWRLVLVKSAAVRPSAGSSATTWASLKTDGVTEVTSGGGYSSSGELLAGVSWRASGNNWVFDATDFSISVTADLSLITACLIRESASDRIWAYATLSTGSFNLSSGNKLIIQFASSGIVVLS